MARLEQYRALERDLIQALSDNPVDPCDQRSGDCPTADDLRRFEAGKYGHNQDERDALMSHLGVCDRCVAFIMRLKHRRVIQLKRRRVWARRAALILASLAVVLLVLWAGSQHPAPSSSGVATVDLRLSSPTRGIEKPDVAGAPRVRRDAGRLRLILPPGSEGNYEFEFLGYAQVTPALRGSGRATAEDEKVILNLTTSLAHLTPGEYSLALRHDGSGWAYYPMIIE